MTAAEFFKNLAGQGVELSMNGDRLRYRAPREVLTPALLEEIKRRKIDILEFLKEKEEASRVYPLTPGQRALWFLHKLAPDSAAYHMAFSVRIHSPVNVQALRGTFQQLLDRHASLRVTFSTGSEGPLQSVQPREVSFLVNSAAGWGEERLSVEVAADYRRPFDLEKGPVFRVTLFSRSDNEHILLIVVHHIVFDAQSLWTLMDEFRRVYPAELCGEPLTLPRLGFSYAEYVRWQEERLKSGVGESLRSFWLEQLGGDPPVLDLPVDRVSSLHQTYRGASHPLTISTDRTAEIRRLAKSQGATLFMTLLAAFDVFLHRLTGQEVILAGSATSGRSREEQKGVAGYFINMIVLRGDLSGDPSFHVFLARIRKTVLSALEHQEYPYPLLVEQFQARRKSGQASLFQAEFGLQLSQQSGGILDLFVPGQASSLVDVGGLLMEPFALAQQEGQFDLSMEMVEAKGALHGVIKYNTDLFDASTVEEMEAHFQALLDEILLFPDKPVSELAPFSEPEMAAIQALEMEAVLTFS